MPFKKIVTQAFDFIFYVRECNEDFIAFKNDIERTINSSDSSQDIIIDFSKTPILGSMEISILIKLLSNMKGSMRFLRLILSPTIKKLIFTISFEKIHNVVLYNDYNDFISNWKNKALSN